MRKLYSPLRYPGGKAKVLEFMKELIKQNQFADKPAYVEPYAGGAAVALGLLLDDYVSEIYINDFDPAIYSFWKYCIKQHPKKFIKKIRDIDVDIDEWKKQVAIYNNPKAKEGFDLGFAAFFLNRCNRSGIIKGGVIGGLEQKGNYLLDCRFNKEDLISRIEKIVAVKDLLKNCLLYLDPPYYKKGRQLYKNFYTHNDHEEIANIMRNLGGKWIVSYDNHPEICKLYQGFEPREFNLTYFAGYKTGKREKTGREIMFFSPGIKLIPNIDMI